MNPTTGFLNSPLDERGGFLLGRAADLADHDDRFGVGVRREERSASMKLVPISGSPPMPMQVVCPMPCFDSW